MLRSRRFFSLSLIVATFCAGLLSSCDKPEESEESEEKLLDVRYIEASAVEVRTSPEFLGRVTPYKEAQLRPQVSGIILERLFAEGSYVKEGQQLYQIDPARYRAASQMAKGQLAKAKANLNSTSELVRRYQSLVQQKAVSDQELDDAAAKLSEITADVAIAKAEVETSAINLRYTKVLAPISGYIGKSSVTKGALVTALQSEPIATIRTLDPVYIDLSLPVSEAMRLQKETTASSTDKKPKSIEVSFKVEGSDDFFPEKGVLEVTELSVDPTNSSVAVRAVVDNPDSLLLPGMFVSAFIKSASLKKKIVVPQASINRSQSGEARLWMIDQKGQLQSLRVETGVMEKQNWVIENGIEEGDKVVVDNLHKMESGLKVNPVKTPLKTGQAPKAEEPSKTTEQQVIQKLPSSDTDTPTDKSSTDV